MDSQARTTEGNQKEELNHMKINKSLKEQKKEKKQGNQKRCIKNINYMYYEYLM